MWAHSVRAFSPSNRPKNIIAIRSALHSPLKLKASNAVEELYKKKSISEKNSYSKRHPLRLRQRQQWSSVYPPPNRNESQKYQQNTCHERDQVHEWLLQSTSRILGEELTLELVNGGDDTGLASPGQMNSVCNQTLPSNFSTDKEFILNAESVIRAWCRWISRCSSGGSVMHLLFDDDDAIRCTVINAAKIVDAVLNRVIAIDERRCRESEEEGNDVEAGEWETKIIELTNVALDVDAWRNERNSDAAVGRAEGWLKFLQQRLEGSSCLSDHGLKLYEDSYRGLIKVCVRSRERRYLERAIELLENLRLEENPLRADAQARLHPSTQTYNLVLYGLANCEPCRENAERAEKILQEMIACRQRDGNYACSPDSNTFRQVITAWTKSSVNAKAAENARLILDSMIFDFPMLDPDASTFNALMTLYLKLGKTEEALSLFDLLNSMHESGRSDTQPDIYSVNLMLKAMTKQRPFNSLEDMEVLEQVLDNIVRPDRQSYNIVIDAWAKSNLREAATRAELLLGSMEAKCRHDPNVKPDGYTFTSVINAIGRSRYHKSRGLWAEKVFHQMKDLHSQGLAEKPTTPVYNALLNTLIMSEESGSIERAEALFSEMQAANITNTRTFNTLLKVYSSFERSKRNGRIISFSRPDKAEQLLDQMELSYYSKGKTSAISPDKYSYTTVISAYGRSNVKRKAAKSYEVLHRMIDSYLEGNSAAKPGTFAFNAVLNACAHTRRPAERVEGFTILCSTLILLRDWAKPDHTTYGTFLQASSNLLPRDEARKLRVVEAVFSSCVKEGQCGHMVLRHFSNVASPELYDALVGRFQTDDGLDIPLQWRRNVAGYKDCLATSYFDSK